MRKEKNRFKSTCILKTGLVYLLLFLLVNLGFSPVYKMLASKNTGSDSISMEVDTEKETNTEESKKLAELDKEYFSYSETTSLFQVTHQNQHYFQHGSNFLSHYPEKDSPPPKGFLFLS